MKKFGIKSMEDAWNVHDECETFDKLFVSATPSDFYFHVVEDPYDPTYPMIHLVPVDYFEETAQNPDGGRCWDQHLNLDHLLPPDEFGCEMECVWSCEKDKKELEEWLLLQGFRQNSEFSEIIEEGYK